MVAKTHHVIYVPGLGDAKAQGQQLVPQYWRLFGVRGQYLPMHWSQGSFGPKLERLLMAIDQLSAGGDSVSLVGTSAGASAVLLAYAARQDKVTGVVCICGKINHPETIRPEIYQQNPAFKESLTALQRALPGLSPEARSRILSMHPLVDQSVPVPDTKIAGAREGLILSVGHAPSIVVALAVCSPVILGFLKRQASRHNY